ncbi:MarR family transcriptional regulator [Streptomyces sp. Ru73]|uniref:MarR family winged helix-turn-helix transcriptional regulator n=1 Tax=Streptomyces sp. Ru73 TaxID=2080748 RepID=UPI000CDD8A07|nr:MarR family transcriptional regulator [Streptomyces sp. Ru73]POX36928.1 MarR family transcriptional regulator [Streptomyces sp. Ru73]
MSDSPPTLTGLTTYLLSKVGKEARSRLTARLAERELRLWHMAVLAALADFGPDAQRPLAERLGIHVSDMARILDELSRTGHVVRERDPADRRRVLVTLTPQGRALLAGLMDEATAVQDEMLAPLTARERATLQRLLLRIYTEAEGRKG